VVSIVLQQIQDNLIHPKVMGKAFETSNPVVIFFAAVHRRTVAGLLGVFLAIPIAGNDRRSWSSEPATFTYGPNPTNAQNIQDTDQPPAAAPRDELILRNKMR